MNIRILLLVLFLIIGSCTYQVSRTYKLPKEKIINSDISPQIVYNKDLYGLNYIYKGSIKIEYGGAPGDIPKDKAFNILKLDAQYLNANIINVTDYLEMEKGICYRCIADIYSVSKDQYSETVLNAKGRDILYYKTNPKLKWEDFKLFIPEDFNQPYRIAKNIMMISDMNLWLGTYKNFSSQAVLFLDASGVKKSFINDSNLIHLQLIYDLTQIYSKRLDKYVNDEIKRTSRRQKIQMIVNDYLKNLELEIAKFGEETEYGKNMDKQKEWMEKIEKEKMKLNI